MMAAALLVACGGDDDGAGGAGGAGAVDDLLGRTFVSRSVTVGGAERPLVPNTQVTLTIDDGNLGFTAGCNSFGGPLAFDGVRLVVADMGGTEIGCDAGRQAQDEWLTGFFGEDPTWSLDGSTLTLTSGDIAIVFDDREVADPDQALVGTVWQVDSIISGDAASSVPAGASATVVFTDTTVSADTGCNGVGGDIAIDGDTITITQGPSTLIACPGPVGDLEDAVRTVLSGPVTFEIEAGTLHLRAAGGAGLDLKAAGS
jgi:heat shock protein HslJ